MDLKDKQPIIEKYYNQLKKDLEDVRSWRDEPETEYTTTVWEYLSGISELGDYLFCLTTDDSEITEILIRRILKALLLCHQLNCGKDGFYSLKTREEEIEHITSLNLIHSEQEWFNYGTSIRGAWIETMLETEPFRDSEALLFAILKLIKEETGEDLAKSYG